MQNKIIYLIFGLIFVFYLKYLIIQASGTAFTYDQGRDLLDLRAAWIQHKIPLIGPETSLRGVYYGPSWYWLALPIFAISQSPFSTLYALWLLIIVSTIGIYLLAKNKTKAFVLIVILMFSNLFWQNSLIALNTHPIIFLLPLVFMLISDNLRNITPWRLVLLGLLSAGFFHFDTFAALALVPILLVYLFSLPAKKSKFIIITGCYLVFCLPQFVFNLRHNFLEGRVIINMLQGQGSLRLASDQLINLNFNHLFSIISNSYLAGFISVIFLLPICLLVFFKHQAKITRFAKLNLIYALILTLLFFVYPYRLGGWHLNPISAAFILFWLDIFYEFGRKGKIALIIFFLVNIFTIGRISFSQPVFGTADSRTRITVVDSIYQDASGQGFNVFTFTPSVYDYPNQYLLWWRAKTKYHYLPEKYFYLENQPEYVPAKTQADQLIDHREAICSYLVIEPEEGKTELFTNWRNRFSPAIISWTIGQTKIEKLCP